MPRVVQLLAIIGPLLAGDAGVDLGQRNKHPVQVHNLTVDRHTWVAFVFNPRENCRGYTT